MPGVGQHIIHLRTRIVSLFFTLLTVGKSIIFLRVEEKDRKMKDIMDAKMCRTP